jgi:hypothetical protein
MDPAELEFLAENDAIEVVPNFTHAQMHLIQVPMKKNSFM